MSRWRRLTVKVVRRWPRSPHPSQHGHGDKLGVPAKTNADMSPIAAAKARLLREHAEGKANGHIAQADGPRRAHAVFQDGGSVGCHCLIDHKH